MKSYDLIVLGGGNAVSLARRAGRAGMKTALVEPGVLGGTCPNRGCIPSKLLLQHATVAESVRRAPAFHVRARVGTIDTRRIFADMREAIARTPDAVRKSLRGIVRYIPHAGTFEDARTIVAGGERITAPRIVIATGTRPALPRGVDRNAIPYLVSDDLFALTKAPASIVFVGGGLIACEFAHFFAGVGAHVTVVEKGRELLAAEDGDVRRTFQAAFAPRIDLRTQSRVKSAAFSRGRFRLELSGRGRGTVSAEALVYAIGRVPNTDALGLDRAGIASDADGFVEVNEFLETSVRGIFACGDVNGRDLYTHAASAQVRHLGDRLADGGPRRPLDLGPMPHAVFTDPEVASVGETEEALVARGARYVKAVLEYKDSAKGRAMKVEHGLAKLLAGPRGEILGFHVVGPDASILLHQVVPIMRWRNHVSSITGAITVHPALNELVSETARKVLEQLPKSARRGPR